jgi:hypothetical protein
MVHPDKYLEEDIMKTLSINEVSQLVSVKAAPAVTVYLATNAMGREAHKNFRTNLDALYKSIERSVSWKYPGARGEKLLASLREDLKTLRPERSRGGLAIFYSESFRGVLYLPTPVSNLAVTADSFHLKPVLKAQQLRRSFYLLSFGHNSADFYKVTADKISRLESHSYDTYLYAISDGPPNSVYTATGTMDLGDSMEQLRRSIDIHLTVENLPLLLAGSLYHQNIYRNTCTYPYLVESGMNGDTTRQTPDGLYHVSSVFMEQYFSAFQEHAIRSFERAELQGETTSKLKDIARAAVHGKIRHLFVAEDRHIWGQLCQETGEITIVSGHQRCGNDDILDDLAEIILAQKGEVTVLPSILMPDNQPVAAILKTSPNMKSDMKSLDSFMPAMVPPSLDHSIRFSA